MWRPRSEIRRLRQENENLRAVVADQALKINTLRRVLAFIGFDVNIED